jgi:hypothetical protein
MLLFLQVVKQLPPINITVQSPPGLPLWVTAAISAGVGSLFTIMTSALMEVIKPWLAGRSTLRAVKREITAELVANLNKLQAIVTIHKDASDKGITAMRAAASAFNTILAVEIATDRYDKAFDEQKTIVYKIDPAGTLRNLNGAITDNVKSFSDEKPTEGDVAQKVWYVAGSASSQVEEGRIFLKTLKVEFVGGDDDGAWNLYQLMLKLEEREDAAQAG